MKEGHVFTVLIVSVAALLITLSCHSYGEKISFIENGYQQCETVGSEIYRWKKVCK